jgi:hypothetical protein
MVRGGGNEGREGVRGEREKNLFPLVFLEFTIVLI